MNTKLILIVIFVGSLFLLTLLLLVERKKRVISSKSPYIEALYALLSKDKGLAVKYLKNAVKGGENRVGAYILLGNLLRGDNQMGKALQIHRSMAIRKDLSYEEKGLIQLAIADDLAALGRIDEAINTLIIIKNIKKNREALLALNKFNHIKGDYKTAYRNIKDAAVLDAAITKDVVASYLVEVSAICLEINKVDEAVKYSELALKQSYNYPSALYISGKALVADGKSGKAMERWISLLNIDISFFRMTIDMIEKTLFNDEKFQKLEAILLDLYAKYPGNPEIFMSLISFYTKKGVPEKIIQMFENEVGQLRMNNILRVQMALVYISKDGLAKAIQTLKMDGGEKQPPDEYKCTVCNNKINIPLAYCEKCCGIDTFKRYHEEIPD
jgi:lipopolysaccharide biosynthesis regulator YciM